MAYNNAGLRLMVEGLLGGPRWWHYSTADVHTDVDAAGYFTDGADFGLKANDMMVVLRTSGTPGATVHRVSSPTTVDPAILA